MKGQLGGRAPRSGPKATDRKQRVENVGQSFPPVVFGPLSSFLSFRSLKFVMRLRLLLAFLGGLSACVRPSAPVVSPSPSPAPATPRDTATPSVLREEPPSPMLPPIPLVEGPLVIKVIYPPAQHLIESRDSNFIFGSIGNGKASLIVNGSPARVYPNGAFLAFVPNPPAAAPRY